MKERSTADKGLEDSELRVDTNGVWGLDAAACSPGSSSGSSLSQSVDRELSDSDERIASLFALMTNIVFSPAASPAAHADARDGCCCGSASSFAAGGDQCGAVQPCSAIGSPQPALRCGSPLPARGRCPQCGGTAASAMVRRSSSGSVQGGAGTSQASSPCPAVARGFERCRVRSNLSFNMEELEDEGEAAGGGEKGAGYACGSAPREGRCILRTRLRSASVCSEASGGSSGSRGGGAGAGPQPELEHGACTADSEHARLGQQAVATYLQERKHGRPPLPPACAALTPAPVGRGSGRPSVLCDLGGDLQLQAQDQWRGAAPQTPPSAPATPDLVPPAVAMLLTPAPAESPAASESASSSEGASMDVGMMVGALAPALVAGPPALGSRHALLRHMPGGELLGPDEACSRPSPAWATPDATLAAPRAWTPPAVPAGLASPPRPAGPVPSPSPLASPVSVSRWACGRTGPPPPGRRLSSASLASGSTTMSAASASSSTSRASVGARGAHTASALKAAAAAEAAAKLSRRRLARERAEVQASSSAGEGHGFMRATAASAARSLIAR